MTTDKTFKICNFFFPVVFIIMMRLFNLIFTVVVIMFWFCLHNDRRHHSHVCKVNVGSKKNNDYFLLWYEPVSCTDIYFSCIAAFQRQYTFLFNNINIYIMCCYVRKCTESARLLYSLSRLYWSSHKPLQVGSSLSSSYCIWIYN